MEYGVIRHVHIKSHMAVNCNRCLLEVHTEPCDDMHVTAGTVFHNLRITDATTTYRSRPRPQTAAVEPGTRTVAVDGRLYSP